MRSRLFDPGHGKRYIGVEILMLSMPCPYLNAIAKILWPGDGKDNVGVPHRRYLGENDKVITAVPRPHAIAQCRTQIGCDRKDNVGARHRRYLGLK